MAAALPTRPHTNSDGSTTTTTTSSALPSRKGSQHLHHQQHYHRRTHSSISRASSSQSYPSVHDAQHTQAHARQPPNGFAQHRPRQKTVKSQYPPDSAERHVEYILVASFDIDRGSIMEHQYPAPVGGDEHMLAELMLPDGAHVRAQDWTIFFLHKNGPSEEEDDDEARQRKRRRRPRRKQSADGQANGGAEMYGEDSAGSVEDYDSGEDGSESEEETDGPPLVYVLNLVNTKQDNTVKRGAIVKAMAICTRHSFLHIYKPLLLLALQQYFANPVMETLASLYDAVNSMDLSLMPRLSYYEKALLQSSEAKDLFLEKFEILIEQKMVEREREKETPNLSPPSPTGHLPAARGRYGLPRDTHEFESVVKYANVPVPVKIPVALSPETVGDFSVVKLITTFSTPHTSHPTQFNPTHPHLTTNGPLTHPIIVLLNALLTQKRVIFLGHNLPSSEVAEAVLAACALSSGGLLRGFTRHAFPYTDLTKIDDLLKVPGFIAGVTNPAFAHKTEWWDLLCDISTGRMRISNHIEQAPMTEGVLFFQGGGAAQGGGNMNPNGISALAAAGATLSAGLGGNTIPSGSTSGDITGDAAFMQNVQQAINERHGENAVRAKFRRWVLKFTRLAAAFEETVYGATPLHIQHSPTKTSPKIGLDSSRVESPGIRRIPTGLDNPSADLPPEVTGHGYIWPTTQAKNAELAANATRIEGWRNTRSYYNFIQDLAAYYTHRPVKDLDLQHLHDKLAKLRMTPDTSANIYLAICAACHSDAEISQLLATVLSGTSMDRATAGAAANFQQPQGLFTIALGLFHGKVEVREGVADLLLRIREHEAGHHFWATLGRFVQMGFERVLAGREMRLAETGVGVGAGGAGEAEEA